jgi:hypothetical protein
VNSPVNDPGELGSRTISHVAAVSATEVWKTCDQPQRLLVWTAREDEG